jgi:diadenosine tetraphosphate (Ap4A) HIT family hydrolase
MSCLFCKTFEERTGFIYENDSVYAIYDNFPVTKGHILIITKRHVPNYFGINKQELLDIDQAISECKRIIDLKYKPTGYNLGINNGVSAGQTIMHLHIHLIPRYDSDCLDPRGGVRGVIPEKQKY